MKDVSTKVLALFAFAGEFESNRAGKDRSVTITNTVDGKKFNSKAEAVTAVVRAVVREVESLYTDRQSMFSDRELTKVIRELAYSLCVVQLNYPHTTKVVDDRTVYSNVNGLENAMRGARRQIMLGQDPYDDHKRRQKAQKETKVVEAVEEPAKPEYDESLRWHVVVQDSRAIVNTFGSRAAAQQFNKDQKQSGANTVVTDSQKAA